MNVIAKKQKKPKGGYARSSEKEKDPTGEDMGGKGRDQDGRSISGGKE